MSKYLLDKIDLKILSELQKDARVSNIELSDKIGLSPSPCSRRVKSLEDQGVIRRYVSLLEPASVGLPVSVFVQVSLHHQVKKDLSHFEEAISKYPQVMECYQMSGDYDYLLRVVVPNIDRFQKFLEETLSQIDGVSVIKSSFALKQVSYRTELPLNNR